METFLSTVKIMKFQSNVTPILTNQSEKWPRHINKDMLELLEPNLQVPRIKNQFSKFWRPKTACVVTSNFFMLLPLPNLHQNKLEEIDPGI